jgi:hypothetical protein
VIILCIPARFRGFAGRHKHRYQKYEDYDYRFHYVFSPILLYRIMKNAAFCPVK